MAQYINKDVLVAEIEKIQNEFSDSPDRNGNFDDLENQGAHKALDRLEYFLDTIETKDVDLEKEIKDYIYAIPHAKTGIPNGWKLSWNEEDVIEIAKHFFEVGLKTQKEEWLNKVCEFLADRVAHDSIDYPMANKHLIEDIRKTMKDD